MSRTLFVSDVHLRPNDPDYNRSFLRFLEQDAAAIYIVGDLFDYWIGPAHLRRDDYRPEMEAIRRKSRECPVYFLRGNRDYLVEEGFERATGTRILGDRAQLDLDGVRVALAHGDFVYNTNPKYTAYRTLMRSRPIEALYGQIPAFVQVRLVRGFRKVSPRTTPSHAWTPEELFDRARPFFDAGADVLIAGHIHLPTHLVREHRRRSRQVFIMGDWCGGTQDYVEHEAGEFRFKRWPR